MTNTKEDASRIYRQINVEELLTGMPKGIVRRVMQTPDVREAMRAKALREDVWFGEVEKEVMVMLKEMEAMFDQRIGLKLHSALRYVWQSIYDGITVDLEGLEGVREAKQRGPLLLLPTHKSHVDYLVLSWLFVLYGIGVPVVASGDNLNMPGVGSILRRCGAFFIRRTIDGDELYKAVLKEYVVQLLEHGSSVEFFIEGGRSRSGKVLQPKLGMLGMIIEAYLEGRNPNLQVCPVSISYDRVMEAGSSYVREMMGGEKKKESVGGLVSALRTKLRESYGHVDVTFSPPVPIAELVREQVARKRLRQAAYDPWNNLDDRRNLIRGIAYKVAHTVSEAAVATPTMLVATVMLTHPGRGIKRAELVSKVEWLLEQVRERGGHPSPVFQDESTAVLVSQSLSYLGKLIQSRSKDVVDLVLSPAERVQLRLELSYYRNECIHLFLNEGIFVLSAYAHGLHNPLSKGVSRADLFENCKFLSSMMKFEFMFPPNPDIYRNFQACCQAMIARGDFEVNDKYGDVLVLTEQGEPIYSFLCALFWPFIDSYWVASVCLMSLLKCPDFKMPQNDLVTLMRNTTETLYYEGRLGYYDAINIDTLKNALALFREVRVLRVTKEFKEVFVSLIPPYTGSAVLSAYIRNIAKFRKVPCTNRPCGMTDCDRGLPNLSFIKGKL